jgi:UDP-3-O-[3-hydroxymyristoyl] N-acetylglucosamine deacetylase
MTFGAYGSSSTLQHTLKNAISCTGTGLHSGTKVTMTLCPAAPDTGIVFRRTDAAARGAEIVARWDNVVDTHLNTTIGNADGVKVGTIEHLMAALSGCAVDNAVVEINGPEIPIMDGSAAPFVFLIECAGVVEQDRPRRAIEILKPVTASDGDRTAALNPGNGFSVSVEIDFESPAVARQQLQVNLVNGTFRAEIARARTFGFDHEVAQLQAMGLARGGSLDNAVVVSGDRVLNADGLRYSDEFVRHKVLDSIGDLYLAGGVIVGHFFGFRCGHSLNNALLRKLFADADAWRATSLESRAMIGGGMARRAAAAASPA